MIVADTVEIRVDAVRCAAVNLRRAARSFFCFMEAYWPMPLAAPKWCGFSRSAFSQSAMALA